MFKKIIAYILIVQHINIAVLSAAPGDLRVSFEPDSKMENHFKLKVFDDNTRVFKKSIRGNGQKFDLGPVFGEKQKNFSVSKSLQDKSIHIKSDIKGNSFSFHIYPDGRVLVGGCELSNLLQIQSFGAFSLTKEIKGKGLGIHGSNIFNQTKIDTQHLLFNVKTGGKIINAVEGEILVGQGMDVLGSDLTNEGRIRGSDGAYLDLNGMNLWNNYTAQNKDQAFKTEISWNGNFQIRNFKNFKNGATLRSSSRDGKSLENHYDDSLLSLLGHGFSNFGHILTNGNVVGDLFEGFNDKDAKIEILGKFFMKIRSTVLRGLNGSKAGFENHGSIDARRGAVIESSGSIKNSMAITSEAGDIKLKAEELYLDPGSVSALGGRVLLECRDGYSKGGILGKEGVFLNISDGRFDNEDSPIESHGIQTYGDFVTLGSGLFVNKGKVHANGNMLFKTSIANHKNMDAVGDIITLVDAHNVVNMKGARIAAGKGFYSRNSGQFINDGNIQMSGGSIIAQGKFANGGEIFSGDDSLEILLINGSNNGLIHSKNGAILDVYGQFANSGRILSQHTILKGSGVLENHQAGFIVGVQNLLSKQDLEIQNEGVLESSILSSFGGYVGNRGTIISPETFLECVDNWGNICDQGKDARVVINRGINYESGVIGGNEGVHISIMDRLSNYGSIVKSGIEKFGLKLDIKGTFENLGIVASQGFMEFLGSGFVQNSGSVTSVGDMISQEEVGVFNSETGEVISNDRIDFALDNLTNDGLVFGKNATLIKTKKAIVNQKNILSEGDILLESQTAVANYDTIQSANGTALIKAPEVKNQKQIAAKSQVSITTNDFENNGLIASDESVETYMAKSAGKGEIRAPKVKVGSQTTFTGSITSWDQAEVSVKTPWVLGDAKLDVHNLTLHGVLKELEDKDFSLNIGGNFDWIFTEQRPVNLKADLKVDGLSNWNHPHGTINEGEFLGLGGIKYQGSHIQNKKFFHGAHGSIFDLIGNWDNQGYAHFTGGLKINSKTGGLLVKSIDAFDEKKKAIFYQEGDKAKVSLNMPQGSLHNTSALVVMEGVMDLKAKSIISEAAAPKQDSGSGLAYVATNSNRYRACNLSKNFSHKSYVMMALRNKSFVKETSAIEPVTQFGKATMHLDDFSSNGGNVVFKDDSQMFVRKFNNQLRNYYDKSWGVKLSVTVTPPHWVDKDDSNGRGGHYGGGTTTVRVVSVIPHNTVASTHVGKVLCGGDLTLNINGTNYGSDQLSKIPQSANFQNTGQLQAKVLNLAAPSVGPSSLTGITPKTRTIPSKISLNAFGDTLAGWGAIKKTKDGPTAFTSILSHAELPSDAEIDEQLNPKHYQNYLAAKEEAQSFSNWLIKRWSESKRGNLPNLEERESIISAIKLQAGWEPDPTHLHKITSVNLKGISPRIAVINNGNLKGDEKQKFPSHINAIITQTALLNLKVELSEHIKNPMVLTRILEDTGYLEATRINNKMPELVPNNWDQMDHKERAAHQLREMIEEEGLEKFINPAIVYQVVEEFGERLLVPVLSLPPLLREMLAKCRSRSVASEYNLKTTGDMILNESMVAPNGINAEAGANMEKGNMYAEGNFNFLAENSNVKGEIVSEKANVNDTAKNLMHIKGGHHEGEGVNLAANHCVGEVEIKKVGYNGGYTDVVVNRASALARNKPYRANFKYSSSLRGYKAAGKGIEANLGEEVESGSQPLVKTQSYKSSRRSYTNKKDITHLNSEFINTSKDHDINITGGNVGESGVDYISERDTNLKFKNQKQVAPVEIHESSITKKGKRKAFRGRKKTYSSSSSQQELSASRYFNKNGGQVNLTIENDSTLHGPEFEGEHPPKIQSLSGNVMIKLLKRQELKSFSKTRKGAFWNSSKQRGSTSTTYTPAKAPQGMEIDTKGQINVEITKKLSPTLDPNLGVKWINSLRSNTNVNFLVFSELYGKWSHKKQGLSQVAALTISLAIAIVTQGTGASIMGGVGGAMGAMANAGFSTMVSQAVTSLCNNEMNPAKAFKDMASKESIKTLAVSVATAGLTYGVCDWLEIPMDSKNFIDIAKESAVNLGASSMANTAISGQDPTKDLLQNATMALGNAAINWLTKKTGEAHLNNELSKKEELVKLYPELKTAPKLNYLEHKIAHGGIGFASGTMAKLWQGERLGKAIKQGGVIGTVTGSTVEVFACALPQQWDPKLRGDIAKLTTTASSMFTRFDPEITKSVAVNAIDNNFVPHEAQRLASELNEQEFVEAMINDFEEERGPLSAQDKKLFREKFMFSYHKLKTMYFHERILTPGKDRLEKYAGMSFEEFRAEQLSEMDPKKLAAHREQAEKSIQNHYRFYQEKQAEFGISSVLSIFGGVFGSRIVPRSINTAKPTSQNSAMFSEKPASVVKTPAKTPAKPASMNPPVKTPVKSAASANPAPKLVEQKTPVKSAAPVVEKKTPNYAIKTASSEKRAKVVETKPKKESQVRTNYLSGRKFQESVHKELRIPENHVIYDVNLPGVGKIGTKPDLPLSKAAVTDVKNVKYITFSKQLQAQSLLAKQRGTSFNLIISPKTEKISKDVYKAVRRSEGKIFEFNQETGKFIERMLEENGNKVIR